MTTTAQDGLHERLQQALQWAAERGGLPGFAELEKFRTAFLDLEEELRGFATGAKAVSDAYGDAVPVPFKVEVEHVAVLGLLVEDLRSGLDDMRRWVDLAADSLYGVDRARGVQKAGGDA